MARKLPWKTKPESPSSTPKRERRPNSSPSARDLKGLRSPSTSPPPEPPPQTYMIPTDDKYRMVEDELLHTARHFTTHLHRAEYNRLKMLAKAQNAATIREIERPVVPGVKTARTRRREAARAVRQQRVATGLQGLMERPEVVRGVGTARDDVLDVEREEEMKEEEVVKEREEDEDEGEDDDPFGVNRRRVRRQKSREQMRRVGETGEKLERDTIPSFF
ncbi:hypothetical protein VFPPC_05232 [Pochonia chlamydosporia 170]|uniref:Uncharacterized protein n=1 Tax=Pochonia chlamydosporia 170 TaxID=1380566 RepID=A0A179FV89_METCM|nr:hypothetical protein VFPPC_05232 [Pochonia chlamydosporia 170]OAQ69110.1 hypothetical protein VFPPC_05232 [Pochonia chlamydosporia 170]